MMKKQFSTLAIIMLLVITIILSLANRQEVVVNYLFGQFRLPLILVIVGSVLVGFLLQYLLSFGKKLSLTHQIKQLKKQLEDSTSTVDTGRSEQEID